MVKPKGTRRVKPKYYSCRMMIPEPILKDVESLLVNFYDYPEEDNMNWCLDRKTAISKANEYLKMYEHSKQPVRDMVEKLLQQIYCDLDLKL